MKLSEKLQGVSSRLRAYDPVGETSLALAGVDHRDGWDRMVNVRLEADGERVYWKFRGGSVVEYEFEATIKKCFAFETRVGGVLKRYIAAQSTAGAVFLHEVGSEEDSQIDSGYASGCRVRFVNNGEHLYLFGYDPAGIGHRYRVYHLRDGTLEPWNGTAARPITGYNWVEDLDLREDNIWGFREGRPVIVFTNDPSGSYEEDGLIKFESFRTKIDRVLEDALLFRNPDNVHQDSRVVDMSIVPYTPDLERMEEHPTSQQAVDAVAEGRFEMYNSNNPDEDPVTLRFWIDGKSFDLDFDFEDTEEDMAEDVVSAATAISAITDDWDVTTNGGNQVKVTSKRIGPAWANREIAVRRVDGGPQSRNAISGRGFDTMLQGGTIETNPNYAEPTLHRAYMLVDILSDGSVTMPGRPIVVSTPADEILEKQRMAVQLSFPAASSDQVYKRYLCGTRWQVQARDALIPSSERYDNSAFFIAGEVSPGDTGIVNRTPDEELIRPLTELVPLTAGIPTLFMASGILPHTVTSYKGSLMLGGYRMDRPLPNTYTTSANPDQRNIFAQHTGSDLDFTMAIAYEYSDGKFSSITDADTLKDGTNIVTIHGLNTLVSAVYLLAKFDTDYFLIDKITQDQARMHGLPIELPTSGYGDLDEYTHGDVLESVTLPNYIAGAIPAQNPRLDAQTRIVDQSEIIELVPMAYDDDKSSQLRYLMIALTDKNVQRGYITDQTTSSGLVYDADFEIIDPHASCKSGEGVLRAGHSVYFQSNHGLSVVSGGKVALILDKRRYSQMNGILLASAHHKEREEAWFFYEGSNKVLVLDIKSEGFRQTEYATAQPMSHLFHDGQDLYVAFSQTISATDVDGVADDRTGQTHNITASVTGQPLGDMRTRDYILELIITGKDVTVTPRIDLQPARTEGSESAWSKLFSSTVSYTAAEAELYGTIWDVKRWGVKPRIQLLFSATDGGFIEQIGVRSEATENSGKSRRAGV